MASALEQFVNSIRGLTASGSYRDLAEYLRNSIELLEKNGTLLDNVLETLDVEQHAMGILFVLVAKFYATMTAMPDDAGIITRQVTELVNVISAEHVRLVPQAFGELCHLYTGYLTKHNMPTMQGVRVLTQAVEKLRLFDTQLTGVHADLCQVSLSAKLFSPVLRFLDLDVTAIASTEDNNLDARYFLLYYYYGGMIYTAMKNYDRALYFFEVAVSTPALAMSHIMLESYKKYMLVSLILHGKVIPIPKYSSQVITRFMKPLSHAYHDLATAYVSTLSEDVRNVTVKYRDVFVRDNNLGLVKQVGASLYKKNIQRLTKTFLTLSLADVASRVKLTGPDEAEKQILSMIKSGEIFATINQKDGMVVFKDDPQKFNTPDMFQKIQHDITRVMELHKQIAEKEVAITLNPLYVKKCFGNQEDEICGQTTKTFSGDPAD